MGRRDVGVEERGRWVFNRLAGAYRARPGYPLPLVRRLSRLAGAGGQVVDLGAGTGLLALPLAALGHPVVAVEPAAAMLEVLGEGAGGLPVSAVHAAAERTGLPGARAALVVLADALQWVEPGAAGVEAGRLCAPGGAVAVVEPRLGGSPFADDLSGLIAAANPRARPRAPERAGQLLDAAGTGERGVEEFRHEERLDPDRLDAVLRSLSLVGPALGPEALADLLRRARELASLRGGATWTREIRLTWGRRP